MVLPQGRRERLKTVGFQCIVYISLCLYNTLSYCVSCEVQESVIGERDWEEFAKNSLGDRSVLWDWDWANCDRWKSCAFVMWSAFEIRSGASSKII